MAGEYGENVDGSLGRPHYHALIFGYNFPDRYIWDNDKNLYRSSHLEKLWPKGFATIGDVSFKSAKYVAQYVMKKITGDMAKDHYRKVDPETGEYYEIEPEYNAMSLKPGIAYDWYQRYSTDVFPSDFIIVDGKKQPTPAYYLKQLKATDPKMFDKIKTERKNYAKDHLHDTTPERLAVRQSCTEAALNRTRSLN